MINRIKISITGKNPDYFLKELIKRNINIYHLEKNYKNIVVIVDYNDYLKVLDIKTTYKIKEIKKYGISRIKEIFRNNLFFFIFALIGIILNIVLSNIIFKIEINHPNKQLVNLIKKDLKEYGIDKYKLKVSYKNKEKIKKRILEKEKDRIEWIEIDNIGTKYIINVEERKLNNNNSKCIERNIIAKKEAIIMSIKSSKGEIAKKKNDYVAKGEVIISGLIHNKDTIVSKKCASGEVYGEVWYKVLITIPKMYKKEELTNNKNYGLSISIFNRNIDIHKKMNHFKMNNLSGVYSSFIPINISFSEYRETKIIKRIYDMNNVDDIAMNIATKKIKDKLEDEECILNKKVLKKSVKNSKIEVEIFLKVKENIVDYQDISNINIEELNKKEE